MKTIMLIAAATLIAAPVLAQTAEPATPPFNLQMPELEQVVRDPTCGGKTALQEQGVFCVTTTQAAIGAVVDAYSAAFGQQDWLAAGGSDNLVVYVKRREGGGCDGFQMLAFADQNRLPAPGAPAWLAFAVIPGDVCASSPSTPAQEAGAAASPQ